MELNAELLDVLDKAQLPIPLELVYQIMQEVGCNAPDERVARLIAADAHKFVGDVLNDIIAVSTVKPMPALNPKNKD
jgi:hypothetical protein